MTARGPVPNHMRNNFQSGEHRFLPKAKPAMAVSESESDSSMVTHSSLHLHKAWHAFNDCRQKGLFCDVVLKVQDFKFPAHRLVLCTCSDYFR